MTRGLPRVVVLVGFLGLAQAMVGAGFACSDAATSRPGGGAPEMGGSAMAGSGGSGAAGAGGSGGTAATGGSTGGVGLGGAAPGTGGGMLPREGGAGSADDSGASGTRFACPAGPFGDPLPVPATPVRIAGVPPSDAFNSQNNTFGILEGPLWMGDALYLSEIGQGQSPPPPSRILKVTAAGAVTIAIPDSGTNGLAVDKSGALFGAVHKDGSISRFDLSTGAATAIAATYGGARFDSPNDLAIRSDGNIYFSDPSFQAPNPNPQPQSHLYRVAPVTRAVSIVDPNQQQPNGVALSLDENTLYVAWPSGIYRYALSADGTAAAAVLLTRAVGSGDGMTLDCAGNLYVATNTDIVVLNPSGTEIHRLTFSGVQTLTNVAFGGADHRTLYVTALGSQTQKGLFRVDVAIPGLPY